MQSIIDKITPSKKERDKVDSIVNNFFKKIKPKLKDCVIELGGSMAKDTWLAGDHDIDIFVKFPYSKYKDKDISRILQERLRGIKYCVMHGSRDYLQVKQGKYLFEIIPVLNIKHSSRNMNITDVSPLHASYVKKYNKNPLAIRLTKQFLKANNLYGAESYIKGFSGYVVELLIIYYGDFSSLVKNASKWKTQTIIDLSGYYKNDNEVLRNINKDKRGNLILIDPVQPERNAAASLSQKNYFEFINLCKKYLAKPSKEFFIEKKFDVNKLKYKYKNYDVILLKAKPLKGKEDVIGSKLLKAFTYIKNKISQEGYKLKDCNWHWNKEAIFYYIIEKKKLPKEIIHYGPPKDLKEHVKKFKAKWKNYKFYSEGARVYIKLKRKYLNVNDYIKSLFKDDYIKNLVKDIKKI